MFYQEEIINGVLCWRGTPKGDWVEFTPEQLTKKIVRLKEENVSLLVRRPMNDVHP